MFTVCVCVFFCYIINNDRKVNNYRVCTLLAYSRIKQDNRSIGDENFVTVFNILTFTINAVLRHGISTLTGFQPYRSLKFCNTSAFEFESLLQPIF